jgi:hypothetical protein
LLAPAVSAAECGKTSSIGADAAGSMRKIFPRRVTSGQAVTYGPPLTDSVILLRVFNVKWSPHRRGKTA